MCTQGEVRAIVADMRTRLEGLFPQQRIDAILFGSYARGDAEDGSDLDGMFLVDERGVLVSPVVEERAYYERNADVLPFFRNVRREGVPFLG